MNDFFTRLAARAVGTVPLVEPRLAPRFAPAETSSTQVGQVWWERMAELQSAELQSAELQTASTDLATVPHQESAQ